MTRDRLPDLCADRKCNVAPSNSSSKYAQSFRKHNKKLHDLLDEAQQTRGLIDVMIENVVIVKNIHNDVLLHTNRGEILLVNYMSHFTKIQHKPFSHFTDIQNELNARTYTINQLAHRIYNKLRELGKNVNSGDDLSFNTARQGPVYNRIKALQYMTMFKMYSDIMQDYNENLFRYHNKCSSILHRQRRLLRKQITSEEIEDMIESPETSLFVDNILAETKEAQQQLSDLETRHKELQKLEKSIAEVKDIFFEMAFLVERQGEQLNCVEYFASKATDDVDKGNTKIKKTREKKQTQRKRKIKIAIIVGTIVVIFFTIVIICS
ncbi:syntaxin-1A-like isoform X1 [Phymastichus coffea]|uniref:syntaxin-1A-like isoform X1 n=1 Tax=Phymastichus coffea TaxID=108790 RepID=UPI00273CCEFF|nr:syntaxin-1A-like isoform X1 [Phymastichus coffea]